jgi:hypothetical protein
MIQKNWLKRLRLLGILAVLAGFGLQAQGQLLGRLPVQLIISDSGNSEITFEDTAGRTLDLGRHMAKVVVWDEGKYVFEFHEPLVLKLKTKNSNLPVRRFFNELKIELSSLDYMTLSHVFHPQSEMLSTFEIFEEAAEIYLEWYMKRSFLPAPIARPKLYRIQGLYLKLPLQRMLSDVFVYPEETDAVYREVIDPQGNLKPETVIKPLAFWEMKPMHDPLVQQILIVASGEKAIDSTSPFAQENDQRGRLISFRRSCTIPISGPASGKAEK